MSIDQIVEGCSEVKCDVLVIGGGAAGPMAALKAKLKNPKATVILLEKANVKRSGAICMGMDGLNNAVVPGHATPEQYTKEITIANDGIVNQKAVLRYAERCYGIIRELDQFGIRFLKNENGDFDSALEPQRARAYLQRCVRAKVQPHRSGRAPRRRRFRPRLRLHVPERPYRRVEKPWVSALSASCCCSM
jgi:succinate dehydrogenase/fumarate reductase flavoprotein subunit